MAFRGPTAGQRSYPSGLLSCPSRCPVPCPCPGAFLCLSFPLALPAFPLSLPLALPDLPLSLPLLYRNCTFLIHLSFFSRLWRYLTDALRAGLFGFVPLLSVLCRLLESKALGKLSFCALLCAFALGWARAPVLSLVCFEPTYRGCTCSFTAGYDPYIYINIYICFSVLPKCSTTLCR